MKSFDYSLLAVTIFIIGAMVGMGITLQRSLDEQKVVLAEMVDVMALINNKCVVTR